MKTSQGIEWGMHCAVLLATLPAGAALSGSALAEYHGVSESYLLKQLKSMAKAGVLLSIPGPKGGFRLAKPPEQISALEIVDAIEGTQPIFRCTEIRKRGPACVEDGAYTPICFIHATMTQAESAWRSVLQERTIADFVKQAAKVADPRAISKTIAWVAKNAKY